MSKRLQVISDDEELLEIQRIAELKQMTVAEWVRQTLRAARKGESTGDPTHSSPLFERPLAIPFRLQMSMK